MPLNIGYIELAGQGITIRVYYDATFEPVGDSQPLIDGPRGWCLDMTNTSGRTQRVSVDTPSAGTQTINVGQGDPVISGPPAGRSRTAAQLATWGLRTRGDVAGFNLTG